MRKWTGLFVAAAMLATAAPALAQTAAIKASARHNDTARLPMRNSVTLTGNISDYSEAASEQQYGIQFTRKVSMRTSLFGGYTQHNDFDVLDGQVQAGITHALSRRALLTVSYTQGIGADLAAGNAVDVKLAGELSPHLRPFVEYNFSRYRETTVPDVPAGEVDEQTVTIGAQILFDAKTSLSAAYQYSSASDREGSHGATAFVTHAFTPRFSAHAGGSYAAAERLFIVSKYAFRRHLNTASATGGFTLKTGDRAEFDFTYQFNRVRDTENIHTFTPAFTWRF